ncbi:putative heat shock protein HspR [Acidimicrobiaceae bacterium]|nr:putative heat shock protein HspR [Acidimicrobiaceae bacterium]
MDFETQAVYVISVAAELAGMHPQTLRIYERRGLVQPARTAGGKQRRYSNADIAQLLRIAQLADLGMNLEGIRQVMALEIEVAELKKEVRLLQDQLTKSTADTSTRYGLVPLRQSVTVFGRRPSIFDKDR